MVANNNIAAPIRVNDICSSVILRLFQGVANQHSMKEQELDPIEPSDLEIGPLLGSTQFRRVYK